MACIFLAPVVRTKAQIVFVGTALSGLVLLIGAGLVKGLPYTALPLSSSPMITLSWLFLPLIFFLGVDIAIPLEGVALHQLKETMQTLKTAIAVFGVLMRQSPNKVRLLTTAAVTFGGAAILALTDARAMHIIKVMITIIGVTLVLGAIGNWRTKRSTSDVSEKGGNNAENQH